MQTNPLAADLVPPPLETNGVSVVFVILVVIRMILRLRHGLGLGKRLGVANIATMSRLQKRLCVSLPFERRNTESDDEESSGSVNEDELKKPEDEKDDDLPELEKVCLRIRNQCQLILIDRRQQGLLRLNTALVCSTASTWTCAIIFSLHVSFRVL